MMKGAGLNEKHAGRIRQMNDKQRAINDTSDADMCAAWCKGAALYLGVLGGLTLGRFDSVVRCNEGAIAALLGVKSVPCNARHSPFPCLHII